MAASANKAYGDFIINCKSRERFERVSKQPGSKKLVHGEWVKVKAEDDDALPDAQRRD